MPRKSEGPPLYGIGAVSRITGLTDHTIRVWERRYSAVTAARAPNGRRQYTEADVQKLALLKRLTENGIAISRVAGDTVDRLRRQVDSLALNSGREHVFFELLNEDVSHDHDQGQH